MEEKEVMEGEKIKCLNYTAPIRIGTSLWPLPPKVGYLEDSNLQLKAIPLE